MSARKFEITNIAAFSFVLCLFQVIVRFPYSSTFPENSEKTFLCISYPNFVAIKKEQIHLIALTYKYLTRKLKFTSYTFPLFASHKEILSAIFIYRHSTY